VKSIPGDVQKRQILRKRKIKLTKRSREEGLTRRKNKRVLSRVQKGEWV